VGSPLGVYALGGVTPATAAACLAAGAVGVAVMGSVMRAPDPGAVVRALISEVEDAHPDPNMRRLTTP
jgi:thiamine-phosphate pyrophosphorylase